MRNSFSIMANVLCLAAVLVGFIIGCAIKLSGRDGGRSIDLSVNTTTQPASPRSIRRTRGRNRREVDPVTTQTGIVVPVRVVQCVKIDVLSLCVDLDGVAADPDGVLSIFPCLTVASFVGAPNTVAGFIAARAEPILCTLGASPLGAAFTRVQLDYDAGAFPGGDISIAECMLYVYGAPIPTPWFLPRPLATGYVVPIIDV